MRAVTIQSGWMNSYNAKLCMQGQQRFLVRMEEPPKYFGEKASKIPA